MAQITTDPHPHGPSDKERKYDRQLRLWAASGQAALEDAHVLLLNSGPGAVGVEVLKNLVLPGIGRFTIADEAVVSEPDLGVNFFLDHESVGTSRARRCAELLQELNPDVQGNWFPRGESSSFRDLLRSPIPYTLIIYTFPINPQILTLVERYGQLHKIPLISINCAGFYSYFRIHFPGSFPVVDTHPDSTATMDLRLLSPWPELSNFAQEMTAGIDSQDAHTHSHIPYVALLLHYLEQWKSTHDNNAPQTYADKIAFRKTVAASARTDNPEGGEENFDEACAAVLKTISVPSLSSSLREVFEYKPDRTEENSSFWIITDAIKKFYVEHNALPLPGSVPDMKAQSDVYVRLQNIYKSKARKDLTEVVKTVRTHPRGNEIDIQEVEAYCRNAAFAKLIQTSPVDLKALAGAELNAEFALTPSLMPIYLALKASERVGALSLNAILSEISKIVADANEDERIIQAAQEVVRAKGSEIHNISALTGGMVAQEIIKVVTKQYIPIHNTCVVDGIFSTTQVLTT